MKMTTTKTQTTAHEGGLAATYVSMSSDEAADIAKRVFEIRGSFARLATEKDDTFRVDAESGSRYILKIANPLEDAAEVSLQLELLEHIARVDPTIPVPRVIFDRNGQSSRIVIDQAGQRRQLRLMSYLDGTPLDSTHSSTFEREKVGETLAKLRHATAKFSHPSDSRVLAWDVKNLLSLRNLLDDVEDSDKRWKLKAGFERFASFQDRIDRLRTQVLHNDFSKSNIVVDHDNPKFVTGIIDFGDAVRTAIAIDVSTALLNQLPRNVATQPVDDLFAAGRDLLHGYLRVADLNDEELAIVPHLVMGRVIARALITLWRSRLFPENSEYILRNTEQGWAQLDWFLDRPSEEVSQTLFASSSSASAAL